MSVSIRWILAACALLSVCSGANAALFGDDEARRAILELRQRVDANQMALSNSERRLAEENAQMRRSLLDLQGQIDALRGELANSRGREEQLARDLADLQNQQKDFARSTEERMLKLEPAKVSEGGAEFNATAAEKAEFDNALALFRKGDFAAAQMGFNDFVRRHPKSGYTPTALFWLGNSQYATRDYQGAIGSFRAMLSSAPDHPRAPEAALAIANSQIELKEVRTARKTLEDLIKAYPQSAAAGAAADRLASLK